MIDYARVAQLLKEVDSFIDTDDAPHLHMEYVQALTAAAALCEAHAAPVDEDSLRDDFEEHVLPTWMPRDRFDDGTYKVPDANSRWHAYRAARARSDARARVADAALESIRDEVLSADANVLDNDQVNYVLGIIDAHLPPPTIEGERG